MARKIGGIIVILMAFLALTVPATAQEDICGENTGDTLITLASGEIIHAGLQEAMIQVNGEKIPVRIEISCISTSTSGHTEPTVDEPAATINGENSVNSVSELESNIPPPNDTLPRATAPVETHKTNVALLVVPAALIPILLMGAAWGIYYKIILPRKQAKPYAEALGDLKKAIKTGKTDKATYEKIEQKLHSTESSRTSNEERRNARFFIAFTNYQQDQLEDAAYALTGLYKDNPKDYEAAYFLAYIYVKQKKYDKALPILEKLQKAGQVEKYYTRKLLGMSYLNQGIKAFNEGQIDIAANQFEKVQLLGDYADQIPADMGNRYIVLGTKALFERDPEEARNHFESLQNATDQAPESERAALKATAALGLAMVAWIAEQPNYPEIEKRLANVISLLVSDEPLTRPWDSSLSTSSLTDKLEALDKQNAGDSLKSVLRDVHFLRGINVLNEWTHLEAEVSHEKMGDMLKQALERFAGSRVHDEKFTDVLLVVGLLFYYLYELGSEKRIEGIHYLDDARKLGMRVPDALEILNNLDKIKKANANAVDKYLQVLDKYLHDETVRKEVRQGLLERLSSYRRVQNLLSHPELAQARHVEPSAVEVRNRTEMLHVRVEELLKGDTRNQDLDHIRNLNQQLKQEGEKLYENAQMIQKKQAELLALTGKQLLTD